MVHSATIDPTALVSIAPRSIAWFLRADDWDHLEMLVLHNSQLLGGYFNVLIPALPDGQVPDHYLRFLQDFDPDLVVLAPDMTVAPSGASQITQPFGTLLWQQVSHVVPSDPDFCAANLNPSPSRLTLLRGMPRPDAALVAVADTNRLEASRLALIACGDVRTTLYENQPALPYRGRYLGNLLRPGYTWGNDGLKGPNGAIVPQPDRLQLAQAILPECQFPLDNAVLAVQRCCELQDFPVPTSSFIGITAAYPHYPTAEQSPEDSSPALVIVISKVFGWEEATLFWNLRASGRYVAWMSLEQLQHHHSVLTDWLNAAEEGGRFLFRFDNSRRGLAFACQDECLDVVNTIVHSRMNTRRLGGTMWGCRNYAAFLLYTQRRPAMAQDYVAISMGELRCSFVPSLPEAGGRGTYTTCLHWDGLTLPQHRCVANTVVSNQMPGQQDLHELRINRERYACLQTRERRPVTFHRPSAQSVFDALFDSAGYSSVEPSSAAKYHIDFIGRAGSLSEAAKYLSVSPYWDLLKLLADNSSNSEKLPGWVIAAIKRRAIHHLHLSQVLQHTLSPDITDYYKKDGNILPPEAVELLEKRLLERGFRLKCRFCSFSSWYPAERIGQEFECSRCYACQVCVENPFWLYKLPEVTYQGLAAEHMEVPLLALYHLERSSSKSFLWLPDSVVKDLKNREFNLDLLCLSDGKALIGEAKSNNTIESAQFEVYTRMCKHQIVDGVVFATSQDAWDNGTTTRIDELRASFQGQIIILSRSDLYD